MAALGEVRWREPVGGFGARRDAYAGLGARGTGPGRQRGLGAGRQSGWAEKSGPPELPLYCPLVAG